jgi:hypothetical protein
MQPNQLALGLLLLGLPSAQPSCTTQDGACICEAASGKTWDVSAVNEAEVVTTGDITGCVAQRKSPTMRARPQPTVAAAPAAASHFVPCAAACYPQALRAKGTGTTTFAYAATYK